MVDSGPSFTVFKTKDLKGILRTHLLIARPLPQLEKGSVFIQWPLDIAVFIEVRLKDGKQGLKESVVSVAASGRSLVGPDWLATLKSHYKPTNCSHWVYVKKNQCLLWIRVTLIIERSERGNEFPEKLKRKRRKDGWRDEQAAWTSVREHLLAANEQSHFEINRPNANKWKLTCEQDVESPWFFLFSWRYPIYWLAIAFINFIKSTGFAWFYSLN